MKLWKMNGVMALLAVSILFSLTAACSEDADKPLASELSPTKDRMQPDGTNPEGASRKYPVSMTYWVPMDQDAAVTIKNYNEMGLYKQLEKITGTKVTFQHPPAAEFTEQFILMMASGKLPDVIYTNWSRNYPDKAIQDGRILRLNEIIEKHAPNLSQLLKDKPYIKKAITSDEGNIYMFPAIGDSPQKLVYHGLMLRKDWLDKLRLEPPATIDEWENVLIAFRDRDPNGNRRKDEIPFFYRQTDIESSYPFVGAFGITTGLYQEGGVVKYGPAQPQFKEYLALMNKWYKEGLIDKDYLTSDTKIRDGKMLDNQLGSMAGWVGSELGAYIQLKRDKQPEFKLIGVPFPSLKPGGKALSRVDPIVIGHGSAISASARYPEQIAAWLDYGYSKAGSVLYNFGVEGESYTLVNGVPKYTDLILNNPKKLSVAQALATYALQTSSGPFVSDPEADKQWHNDPEQMDAMSKWAQADHSKVLPASLLNAEEQARYASIMTDLNSYKDGMINKFIMGAEPLNKFDEYTKTLAKLGIDDVVKIYQTAYGRYLKK